MCMGRKIGKNPENNQLQLHFTPKEQKTIKPKACNNNATQSKVIQFFFISDFSEMAREET